jgi:hypothetical protein
MGQYYARAMPLLSSKIMSELLSPNVTQLVVEPSPNTEFGALTAIPISRMIMEQIAPNKNLKSIEKISYKIRISIGLSSVRGDLDFN